ncbi:unnamed protein product [Somion occarium]|uniref:F-box domain-containing protein n=2 Tax=Somion occarium TaxID=3059160 RepID=A0ABP1DFA9_9APHY
MHRRKGSPVMSSTPPVLPPELIDQAIDHLWDDHEALEACSLTCRSWVPTSRLHLFRTVRVRSADDCTKLSALLDASPVIAHCVRKLTVSAEYKGVDSNGRACEDDAWVNQMSTLLSKLYRVHTLALSRVKWSSLLPETKSAFAVVFKSVKMLLLFEVRFDASGDVLGFLFEFPILSELYFHGVSWDRESPASQVSDTGGRVAKCMGLTYLFLDPKSSPTLVTEWLLNRASEQRLRTIQLCWREIENTRASESELECLRIEFPFGLSEEVLLQNQLTLSHNTGLRTLHFGGLDVSAAATQTLFSNRLFTWVAVMLGQISSSSLREVIFELELPDVCDLQSLDWLRIDRELSRREFNGLLLRFYVNCTRRECGSSLEGEVRRELESRLPNFLGRGTLRVSCL